jgi:hypothetical protein
MNFSSDDESSVSFNATPNPKTRLMFDELEAE